MADVITPHRRLFVERSNEVNLLGSLSQTEISKHVAGCSGPRMKGDLLFVEASHKQKWGSILFLTFVSTFLLLPRWTQSPLENSGKRKRHDRDCFSAIFERTHECVLQE